MLQTRPVENGNKTQQSSGFLHLTRSGGQKEIIEIDEYITIGRDPSNLLVIDDPFVSSRHSRIERTSKGFVLKDYRSRNGTFLNHSRVVEAILTDKDLIAVGETQIQFRYQADDRQTEAFLVSQNYLWQEQLNRFENVANSEMPVLILGESGTGKELVAQHLHRLSPRKHSPLVSVNCSALGESLVESELFGHKKGSFTGAMNDRKGAFESARGGTLFLDEIGDLPMALQPKLLRALENQEIRPVGSDESIKTDVRIVAATHQNLKEKVAKGEFREDLYFRLNVVKFCPPPLRLRMEDFETLFYHFCKEYRISFNQYAILKLKQHTWPGNIRELKNCVARAKALFGSTQITENDIGQLVEEGFNQKPEFSAEGGLPNSLKIMEKQMIVDSLKRNRGNQRRSAQELGIPKSTFHDRLKTFNINPREYL